MGFLSNSKSETVSLSERVNLFPGVSIRQNLVLTEGQEMKYKFSQTISNSTTMYSRNTLLNNRINISLVDIDNKESISTNIIPESIAINFSSENSASSVINRKREQRIMKRILEGAWILLNIDEVINSLEDGKAIFSKVTDVVVTLKVDSTKIFLTNYNSNHLLGIFTFPFSGFAKWKKVKTKSLPPNNN